MTAKEWFEAASRMCKGQEFCENCPLNKTKCPIFRLEYDDIETVEKWAKANPAEPAEIVRVYTIEITEVVTDDRVRSDADMVMLGDIMARDIKKRMPDARLVRCVGTGQRVTEWRETE